MVSDPESRQGKDKFESGLVDLQQSGVLNLVNTLHQTVDVVVH